MRLISKSKSDQKSSLSFYLAHSTSSIVCNMEAIIGDKLQDLASAASFRQDAGQSSATEPSTEVFAGTVKVRPDDSSILFGRGKAYNSHPGNLKMRSVLDKYRDEYRQSLKGEKCKLVRKVHDELVGQGMKFMKQAEGGHGWVEVDLTAAVQKVGLSLRNPKILRHKPTANKSVKAPVPDKSSSSAFANVGKGQPSGITSKEASVATAMQKQTGNSLGLEELGDLLNHRSALAEMETVAGGFQQLQNLGDLMQPDNAGFAEHAIALLQNHFAELELERLRSTLSACMGPLAHSSQQSFQSANQVYTSAERDLLASVANSSSQFNYSFPDEDPMFWIRLAAASLLNTGGT
ncbi:unnamed protein product [Cylindrotheca closterium]|uniref:DUF6824 domain-containing protein n=1 Tax=Cylindrotheca closterium TaxID=2856 RepID=A0AAD2JH94_9STRA|nr:unnamed protein product [Cylindrotheca closterium]